MGILKRTAIHKRTIVDEEDGTIELVFEKRWDEDGTIIKSGVHRATILPGADADLIIQETALMLAEPDQESMPGGPFLLDVAAVTPKIKKRVKDEHTPARVKAAKDKAAAQMARALARLGAGKP